MSPARDIRRVQAREIKVIAATKVLNHQTGEPMVAVGIGESVDDSEFLVMSIDDARRLGWSLADAIVAPPPIAT